MTKRRREHSSAHAARGRTARGVGAVVRGSDTVCAALNRNVECLQTLVALCNLGHAAALNNLGNMYAAGRGVKKDKKKAFDFYLRSAQLGEVVGMYNAAEYYYFGDVLPKNDVRAFFWYKRAADAGDIDAAYKLGYMYQEGAIRKDYTQAAKYFLQAATAGHAEAQYFMGWLCEWGKGVPLDLKKAKQWYRKSAAQGDKDAKKALWQLKFLLF